ncbi:hypothetical protein [Puniceicoccus vermicola]|uniref:Uncharacterized protein n=1 Tax=Puniceicoccus vermicola TaxID=388746 RepID=A0A7X1E5C4_9BACT|nr:hypothetical protein [Puniceicoccus vermicola]MBC2602989.1 hypothetical protein [Puniceicoccus vermicola]
MVSSGARLIKKKDGSGNLVLVSHELATQPGVIRWEEILDPVEDSRITFQGEEIIKSPAEPDFKPITLEEGRQRIFKDQLIVGNCEVLNRS